MIELVESTIDVRAVEAAVARPEAGAICTFLGVVRNTNLGRAVAHLEYEAYPDMALPAMERIADVVAARWPGALAAIVHRTGRLEIGESSVVIVVSSPHRAQAFEACRWAIDTLKTAVPIWKKEIWSDGEAWTEGVEAGPIEVPD